MKQLIIIILALTLISANSVKRDNYDTRAKMQAVFMYNFTKYINWPESKKSGAFVIGLLGKTPLMNELQKMAQSKKALSLPIIVRKYNTVEEIDDCHILFVPRHESLKINGALQQLLKSSTLVITENSRLSLPGAGINFVTLNNRQKFELCKANIERHDLKVSSSLLSLAIIVE